MTTQTKPSAGAVRAARVLEGMSDAAHKGQRPQLIADEIAEVIQNESRLAELLDVLKSAQSYIETPGDLTEQERRYSKIIQIAIAKATNSLP